LPKYLCIACEVLARPVYLSAARSPHIVDVILIERGLHNEPGKLKTGIQDKINSADGRGYDAILLGYGLCGNGTAGLQTCSAPMTIPRVHDCLSLLLGNTQRYLEEFENNPGTYWYSQDFIERADTSGKFATMGLINDDDLSKQYESFFEKYGKENADYLMEVMGGWKSHYQRAAFIDTGINQIETLHDKVRLDAEKQGWLFSTLAGDLILIRQLLNGEWPSANFIVVPPNHKVGLTYDHKIFKCDAG
jgi:hypothetical protein